MRRDIEHRHQLATVRTVFSGWRNQHDFRLQRFRGVHLGGAAYPAAIGLATILGVAFNFQSTGRLVFGGALAERLPSFLVVYGLGYAVNVGAVAILLSLGLNVYAANALIIVPLALLTFLLQRRFVFQTS
jgi:putative flippase GtrA